MGGHEAGASGAGGDGPLPGLVAACGGRFARPATVADHVAGTPARWVVTPGDADEVGAVLRVAVDHGLSVAACGAGTKLDWGGAPTRVDVLLDTRRLTHGGAGHHGDGPDGQDDGVTTVGAGTPVRAVRADLARSRRRLALDVGSAGATIGGVLAVDEAGPLRMTYGTARDLAVSLEFVTADGVITAGPIALDRSRARNGAAVEPADAASMLCGSYGTLGIITRATLRVHPTPAARAWVVREVRSPMEVRDLTGRLFDSSLRAAAVEIDLPCGCDPRDGGRFRLGALAVLLEGSRADVDAQARVVTDLLGKPAVTQPEPPEWWGQYPFTGHDIALRLRAPVSELHAAVYALRDAAGEIVPVRGSAGCGVVYAGLHAYTTPERALGVMSAVRTTLLARGGSCTVLRAPAEMRLAVDGDESMFDEPLVRMAKAWLDPQRRFVPGRLPCVP